MGGLVGRGWEVDVLGRFAEDEGVGALDVVEAEGAFGVSDGGGEEGEEGGVGVSLWGVEERGEGLEGWGEAEVGGGSEGGEVDAVEVEGWADKRGEGEGVGAV